MVTPAGENEGATTDPVVRVLPDVAAIDREFDYTVPSRVGPVSVGDVVLNGGEVAACLVIEAVTRLLPGAMGNAESPLTESFGEHGLLEEPHFTRPADFRGWPVPDVLRSGDHARVARWRHAQALHRTLTARPDLVAARGGISDDERALLEEFPPVPYP